MITYNEYMVPTEAAERKRGEMIRDYLSAHFPELRPEERIALAVFDSVLLDPDRVKQYYYARTVEEAVQIAYQLGPRVNIGYGVNPRCDLDKPSVRVSRIVGLRARFDDHRHFLHDEALPILDAFRFPPTTLIRTGDGYDAHWALAGGFSASFWGEQIDRLCGLLSVRLHAAYAIHHDAFAILPGTFNGFKGTWKRKLVYPVRHDPDRRYGIGDFLRHFSQ